MHNNTIAYLGMAALWLLVTPCQAKNTLSGRPSEQQQNLPALTPEADKKPFVLPSVEQLPSHSVKATEVKVTIKRIIYTGNSVFKEADLQRIALPFLHHAIDVADLEDLRYQLTQHYIKNGYVNSGAIIPNQTFKDGTLTLQLVEGKLTTINIDGNGWLHPDYIRKRLMDDKPFNATAFQDRYLQLLNDPLIERINGNLKPLPELGQSALDLHITRARPYQLALHFNNYNPPSIGAEQLQAEAWVSNLTRWGDKFDFQFNVSQGAATYAGGLSMPLNAYGTVLDFHFNTGRSSVIEESLNTININSHVNNFTWTLSHPVYQTVDHNLTLGINFASRFTQTDLGFECFAFQTDCRNKAVALRFFQDYSGRFDNQVFAARSTFSLGLDAFGSTVHKNAKDADSRFFAWLGQMQYAKKILDNGAQLRLHGNLQLTGDDLLSQEKMAVGGVYSVRGYRENELVRDNGYSASIEFHYPLWDVQGTYANQLTVFPFMDYGAAWDNKANADYLHAVGIGLSWQGLKHIKADFIYAHNINKALTQSSHDLQDEGIFFNVSMYAF
jgi:hemolysin activation/secretion protein